MQAVKTQFPADYSIIQKKLWFYFQDEVYTEVKCCVSFKIDFTFENCIKYIFQTLNICSKGQTMDNTWL